jgi:nitrogen fixation protein FixH
MSWGYKIAFAYGSFVMMMLFFIFIASRQTNDLVEDHYYEKELQFQNVLNAIQNLSTLHTAPQLVIDNNALSIHLPEAASTDITNGKIEFIRLSDISKDLTFEFVLDENKSFKIPVDKFQVGIYKMVIQWKSHGVPYMYENQFNYAKP